ncbi:calcium-transporting P-type ATPase, PMR1-type [Kwoniella bestiolae CBS 10118]|uniref:Calcium-transporting ATPase n=1 Tax=Kwoniella bestiolae CBS 10118 TaxID=1296100 RepID=A0A1B9G351_9TREE|nr:calcium-transporting P-type ATPase, PMR1-type [Kwoniella bestiolae CBS 10118]OCF25457.1 calcium-transporting P-type ATPase, PMR1-type [Kwoniella bestiolae CBS 10118]
MSVPPPAGASASSYGIPGRNASNTVSRGSYGNIGLGYTASGNEYDPTLGGLVDEPGKIDTTPVTNNGGYAYSTTLRRQASVTEGFPSFHHSPKIPTTSLRRDSSPHVASPYRSQHHGGGGFPLTNGGMDYEQSPFGGQGRGEEEEEGFVGRLVGVGKRIMGKKDYEQVRMEEEEKRLQTERRQRETPSAIFAHKTIDETIQLLSTHPTQGLPSSSLSALLARYGPNEFELPPADPLFLKFAKQVYENPLILLLLGSSVVSALMGNYDDAACVVVAVGIVLTVGFVQEQRSEKSLEALNKLVPHYCHLIRNGHPLTPLANALVPGDLVTFSVGDRIPADIRLITAVSLEIDESALTGETRPARKNTDICERGEGEDTHGEGGGKALGERHCMAFMGTLVRSGHGSGIVVGTGKDTEFGVIFSMMQDVEEKRTPLQLDMDDLAKRLSLFSFGVIGVIFLIGVLQNRDWLEMFTIGVSLAVAAIPEGLPIVTTVTLALGVLRMSKRKAIVKKLPSVEALGSVSVICSDKTGTLTKNEMTVTHMYAVDDLVDLSPLLNNVTSPFGPKRPDQPELARSQALKKTALVGSICNNAFKNEQGVNVGQATEVALLNVLPVIGADDQRKNFTRKSEIPFSSETKIMSVTGSLNGGSDMIYLKGAVEQLISKCRYFYVTDSSTPSLDSSTQKTILDRANEVSARGLRVIAMAYGFPKGEGNDLIFVGFQAMMDPPRKGVSHAVSALHNAGVQVVMITGDAEPTALAIAKQLGLKVNPSSGSPINPMAGASSCMLGTQVDQLTERELIERVPSISVYARTTPRHKMAIVKAWQMRGAVVAMTGDGVNDSPALKMADIGISMGKSGTDVAKEAADVILVDDDFSSILPAVEEGKSIFYNIQNFLSFQLSTAVAALTLITLSTFFKLANPLNAMQILFINILMDGPPAQALGVDPVDKEIMRRPPRRKGDHVLSRRLIGRVAFSATMIVLGTLYIYLREISDGSMSRRDQTMTFTGFVFLDLVSALQNRGLTCTIFKNKMLFLTISISFFVQLLLIYLPILQHIFQTEALSLRDLFTLLGLGVTSASLHEVRRWYERKGVERELMVESGGGRMV